MVTLKPNQISQWANRIIDVRNPDEYAAERLTKAECVPLPQLLARVADWDRAQPLLVMCKSGLRSKKAADQLEAAGFIAINMVEGGLDACKRDGLPVVVDRKGIPLFRQVMIAAGAWLLIGLGLSFLNPAFLLIDWFVAIGLIFAGISGFCPMACILEKMPWNAGSHAVGKVCAMK